jgi:hypothetical protein
MGLRKFPKQWEAGKMILGLAVMFSTKELPWQTQPNSPTPPPILRTRAGPHTLPGESELWFCRLLVLGVV